MTEIWRTGRDSDKAVQSPWFPGASASPRAGYTDYFVEVWRRPYQSLLLSSSPTCWVSIYSQVWFIQTNWPVRSLDYWLTEVEAWYSSFINLTHMQTHQSDPKITLYAGFLVCRMVDPGKSQLARWWLCLTAFLQNRDLENHWCVEKGWTPHS